MGGLPPVELPRTGALGPLVAYATDPATEPYQPMHVNFGWCLAGAAQEVERYLAYADRATEDLSRYLASRSDLFPGGPSRG